MKVKMILLIALLTAIITYKFKDQLFNNTSDIPNVAETPLENPPSLQTPSFTHLKIENIVINKSTGLFYEEPPNLNNLISGLDKIFTLERLTFEMSYSFHESFETVPNEKWDTDIVITRTLAVVELVKQGREIEPLFFVSPSREACFQEVQIVSLMDSKIGSIPDLTNKIIALEELKGVINLPIRRLLAEEKINPKSASIGILASEAIEKIYDRTVDAGLIYSGFYSANKQIAKDIRVLMTTAYGIPCYTLYMNKRIPEAIRKAFKEQLLSVHTFKDRSVIAKAAIGLDYYEEISSEVMNNLQAMAKKYEQTEIVFYSPPSEIVKLQEMPARTNELSETEKQKELILKNQENQLKENELSQDNLQQQRQLLERAPVETLPVNEFKNP